MNVPRTEVVRASRAERVITALMAVCGVAGLVIAVAALRWAGIGWDATFDVAAARAAEQIEPAMGIRAAYEAIPNTSEFYGFVINQIADLLHGLFASSSQALGPYDPETYLWLGLANIGLSVVGAACLAAAVMLAMRSALIGSVAGAVLLTLPMWLGMSHINVKDIPVAVGLTMVSSGLVVSWVGATSRGRLTGMIGGGMAAIGACLALATRAGILLPILALAGGSAAAYLVVAARSGSWRRAVAPLVVAVAAPTIAIAFGWLTNPIARISIPHWLYDSFMYSRGDFPWSTVTRTAGIDVSMDAIPLWFVPAWLLAQLPLMATIAAVMGLIASTWAVLSRRGEDERLNRTSVLSLVPFAVQGIALPLAVIVSGAQFYDGIRHLLFMFPTIAVACGTAVAWALDRARASRPRLLMAIALPVALVGANLWADVRWFPYDYAFVNPVAGSNKAERAWDLDYWGTSAREGIERLREAGFSDIVVVPHGEPGRPYGALNLFDPGSGIIDPVVFTPTPGQEFGYYWFNRFEYPLGDYDCSAMFTIERDGHVLGEGGGCRLPATIEPGSPRSRANGP